MTQKEWLKICFLTAIIERVFIVLQSPDKTYFLSYLLQDVFGVDAQEADGGELAAHVLE